MDTGIGRIEREFSETFAHWEITLPAEDVAARSGGHIFEQGWHIGDIWGEEDGETYLEYLAQHRMTNDRHVRIYESGRTENLPTAPTWTVIPKDATEEEAEAASRATAEKHRQISAELREKGLLPPKGGNQAALEINEYLRSGGDPGEG